MKRKIALIVVVLSSAAGTTLWALQRHGGERPLQVAGTIEARDVEVGSQVGGRVAVVHAEEGDAVSAGAPIVTLEPDLLDPQIEEQRGRLAEVQAQLERVLRGPRREDVAEARIEWQDAERERARLEPLLEGGMVAQQQYDALVTRAALARERLRELENGSRAEDVAAARAAVARESGRLAYLMHQRAEMVVLAPSAGVIQTLDLRPGDLVAAHAPVARLLDPADQWVRGYVPEPELGRVHVGQPAWVTVDTWRDRRFKGRVTEIRTRAEYTPRNVQTLAQRSEQVFAVKVALDAAPELKPGMAAIMTLAADAAPKGGRP
jgi:HlyD family secretion protein